MAPRPRAGARHAAAVASLPCARTGRRSRLRRILERLELETRSSASSSSPAPRVCSGACPLRTRDRRRPGARSKGRGCRSRSDPRPGPAARSATTTSTSCGGLSRLQRGPPPRLPRPARRVPDARVPAERLHGPRRPGRERGAARTDPVPTGIPPGARRPRLASQHAARRVSRMTTAPGVVRRAGRGGLLQRVATRRGGGEGGGRASRPAERARHLVE